VNTTTLAGCVKKAFKRPYGTHRIMFGFPGTEVPGYFHSFLRNDGEKDLAFLVP
jgi:hypothetical protein